MSLLKRARRDGTKFLNPVPTVVAGFSTMRKVLPLYLTNREETTPKSPLGPFATDVASFDVAPPSGLRVTWFGHSSSLVEIDGVRVLIDPVWDKRASPSRWFGPARFFPPTLALDALPPVDAVLISHDYYDHLGEQTVRALSKLAAFADVRWITSLKVGAILTRFGVRPERITELDWTESTDVASATGAALKLTAWPARHFSGRSAFNRFETLWSSFVLEGLQHRVYFGADSGWWDGFAEIAAQYEGFDLTMLEIGAYHPLWESIHLGPDNAVRAYEAMGGPAKAGLLMPIHWGLFNLALHGWRQPIERLEALAAERGVPLWSPTPGVPTEVEGSLISRNWRHVQIQSPVSS